MSEQTQSQICWKFIHIREELKEFNFEIDCNGTLFIIKEKDYNKREEGEQGGFFNYKTVDELVSFTEALRSTRQIKP